MRSGSVDRPVLYEVERVRDGRSFVTRRVVAIQNGQAIFNMDASAGGTGFEHSAPMPNVPLPRSCKTSRWRGNWWSEADPRMSPMSKINRPFHLRSVFELGSAAWETDRFWNPTSIKFGSEVKLPTPIADDEEAAYRHQALSRCLVAYASDMGLVSTAVLPHQSKISRGDVQMASWITAMDSSSCVLGPVVAVSQANIHRARFTGHGALEFFPKTAPWSRYVSRGAVASASRRVLTSNCVYWCSAWPRQADGHA